MILTGKAKENFYKFLIKKFPLNENEVEKWFISLYNEFKNALIIEWFDSVWIYISINYVDFYDELRNNIGFETYITYKGLSAKFRSVYSRQEAIKHAIKKANEIYNEKYSISQ